MKETYFEGVYENSKCGQQIICNSVCIHSLYMEDYIMRRGLLVTVCVCVCEIVYDILCK